MLVLFVVVVVTAMVMFALVVLVVVVMAAMVVFALVVVVMTTMSVSIMLVKFEALQKSVNVMRISLENFEKFIRFEFGYRRSYYGCVRIKRLYKFDSRQNLIVRKFIGFGNNDSISLFDLIVVKLAEVLVVHFAFAAVNYGCYDIYLQRLVHFLDSLNYIGKFTHARRFYYNSVGSVILYKFFHRFRKIADERAAYTTRIYFLDLYSAVF